MEGELRDFFDEILPFVEKGIRLKVFSVDDMTFLYFKFNSMKTASSRLALLHRLSGLNIPLPNNYTPFTMLSLSKLVNENFDEIMKLIHWHVDHNYHFENSFPLIILILFGFDDFVQIKEIVKFDVKSDILGEILRLIVLNEEVLLHLPERTFESFATRLLHGIGRLHSSFGISPKDNTPKYFSSKIISCLSHFSSQLPTQLLWLFVVCGHKVSEDIWEALFEIYFDPDLHEPMMEALIQLELMSEDIVFLAMKESLIGHPDCFRYIRSRVDPALLTRGAPSIPIPYAPESFNVCT